MEYSEDQIQRILTLYKQNKIKNKENYQKIKDNEEFKMKNRERAKAHYHQNKELKKNHYDINKELIKARTSYHYYLKQNRLEEFKEKYPERYDKLVRINYIKLPSEEACEAAPSEAAPSEESL